MNKIKFYTISLFKHESYIGLVEIVLFLGAIVTAIEWLIYDNQKLEPYTIILASTGGILDIVKRIIKEPKLPKLKFSEVRLKTSTESSFFIGATLTDFNDAIEASRKERKGLFLVIYDPEHSTNSKLVHSLGYFSQYEMTKRLINQNFIQAIVPSTSYEIKKYIPDNYHMENCLLVVLDKNGKMIRQEGVYANPDEGLKRVRVDINKL